MGKPKIAFTWTSSCGGCEESLLDLGPDLLSLTREAEIIYWPIALDYKKERLDRLADGALLASWINGAIRLDEHEETVRLLRQKSQFIVAHGTCAHLGGVVGLANLFGPEEILAGREQERPPGSVPENARPNQEPSLPGLTSRVKTLDQVIPVDYCIPGCPPTPDWNRQVLAAILENRLPPQGGFSVNPKPCAIIAFGRKAGRRRFPGMPLVVCIKRSGTRPAVSWPKASFAWGPATRGGCAGRCLNANMPCRGCFGPLELVKDQGAKVVSFLASLSEAADEEALQKFREGWIDPVGLAYQYSLSAALVPQKVKEKIHG